MKKDLTVTLLRKRNIISDWGWLNTAMPQVTSTRKRGPPLLLGAGGGASAIWSTSIKEQEILSPRVTSW